MTFDTETASLNEWLEYIQTLHFREIELSLERVRRVYQRLYPNGPAYKVITLAGTNGKGSTAEVVSSILRKSGYTIGKFSSPHLVDFSERFDIGGRNVDDESLLASLANIESARGEVPITFFEFNALLAIDLFARAQVDVAVMEVGLGGRLDAINILDAHISIITSISIDHTSWLGDTVEQIAFEKAGIARSNRPCVVGIEQPPASIIEHCSDIKANLIHLGEHYNFTDNLAAVSSEASSDTWRWSSGTRSLDNLPLPFAQRGVQLSNAATALMAIDILSHDLPITDNAIRDGLADARLLARCQVLQHEPCVVLDVSHNESSVKRLAEFSKQHSSGGRVYAIVGMLQDKEIGASLQHLQREVDFWRFVSIEGERGASAEFVQAQTATYRNSAAMQSDECYGRVEDAYDAVMQTLKSDDLLLVFGSFYIAGDILRHIRTLG